jgi:RyR domain
MNHRGLIVPKTVPLDQQLGKVSYETVRAWSEANGEPPKKSWDDAEPWRQESAVKSVRKALAGDTAKDLHESWRTEREGEGWKHADKKDDAAKTNPSLRRFADLTDTQRRAADLFAATVHTVFKCGVERWAVKTMTDPQAARVNLEPQESTVKALWDLALPPELTDRQEPEEFATYTLKGTIVLAKLEKDKDIHMVLLGDLAEPKVTMVIESVSPDCAAGSIVADQIAVVRQQVEERFPEAAAGGREEPRLKVTVTGVGFFDRLHHQDGLAKNGIELHPVIAFTPD